MKAHFQVNQNPDSRELKMLSQKTGLDKKVLQVRRERGGEGERGRGVFTKC